MKRKLAAAAVLQSFAEIAFGPAGRYRLKRSRYPLEKRVFDVSVILVCLPVWLPILGLILLAVKLTDLRRPALFRQWRTGRGAKRFLILKVRTMTSGEPQALTTLPDYNSIRGSQSKSIFDARVTRLGRLLRKTHLDELPQLFNVLKGDMSLVGPRPNTPPVELYREWWRARLQCLPGITGLWQVRRSENGAYDERARLDIRYLRNRSIALDLRILFETFVVSFVHRGGA
jgi:lipopolysaccharide/colanic/teichoic acid biosynthesis glycosyltransferase